MSGSLKENFDGRNTLSQENDVRLSLKNVVGNVVVARNREVLIRRLKAKVKYGALSELRRISIARHHSAWESWGHKQGLHLHCN